MEHNRYLFRALQHSIIGKFFEHNWLTPKCGGVLSILRALARVKLCATPTFDVISAQDMLYEEKVNK